MGAWGTGILDSDDALDIYSPYVENFKNGIPLAEIKADLRNQLYYESEPVLEDNTGSWLGYAQAQLETNTLEKEVVQAIKQILDENIDAEYWEDEDMLKERNAAIESLYQKLKSKV